MNLTPELRKRLLNIITILILIVSSFAAISLWQWIRNGGGFEAVYVAIGVVLSGLGIAYRWLKSTISKTLAPARDYYNPQELRVRRNLLNFIKATWLDGYLNRSLYGNIIQLRLHYRPDVIGKLPWQPTLKNDQPVPINKPLHEIFFESGRSLLILGRPGGGKTITMLQLAEQLHDFACKDPTSPIPIVINLTSWSQKKLPLSEWLVEEMFSQYGIARNLSQIWITANRLIYLLDGFDEVAPKTRHDCLSAINRFKSDHPAELIVCSRTIEYTELKSQIHFGNAIEIQPLTDNDIENYLNHVRPETTAVRATLKRDSQLRELARTPIMLSLITDAYNDLSTESIKGFATKSARREHILQCYINNMFKQRPLPRDNRFTQSQAVNWLANVAYHMFQNNQSIFYLEQIQPTWLPTSYQRYYTYSAEGIGRIRNGFSLAIVAGLTGPIFRRPNFFLGLISGLLAGVIGGIISNLLVNKLFKKGRASYQQIEPVEVLKWQWPDLLELSKVSIILGLSNSLVAILIFGMNIRQTWIENISSIIPLAFVIGVITGMNEAFGHIIEVRELSQRNQPNQGIWNSGWNAIRLTLLWGAVSLLMLVLAAVFFGGVIDYFFIEILGALFGGLVISLLYYGAGPFFQHYILRFLLWRADILPFFADKKLIYFLDIMSSRIILHRVGGGWVFIHRILLEYFASLHKPQTDPKSTHKRSRRTMAKSKP